MNPTDDAARVRLWGLEAPTLTIDSADLVVGLEGDVTIPCPAFLIQHPEGLVMFDTSWAPAAFDDAKAEYGDLVDLIQIRTRPEDRLDRQLERLGFTVEDVKHVILSHGHADHSGGLRLFPHARFYIGPEELARYDDTPPEVAHLYRQEDIAPIPRESWTEVTSDGLDLFGDGTVQILHGPGHSPGQLMLLVKLSSQEILLTGDAVHLQEGLDLMRPDGVSWDDDTSLETLRRINELRDRGVDVWIGHDPRHWAAHKHAPEFYA
jgi:Zn-dependent hydrolases, including glyoxylases